MNRLNRIINVSWVYASSLANVSAGLILLPFVLHYLMPTEVGVWFVFITIITASQLIELGFQATFTRNIAYIYEGAQSLNRVGIPDKNDISKINYSLLKLIITSVKFIYLIFSAVGIVILISISLFYVPILIETTEDHKYYQSAWLLFAVAGILNISNGWMIGLLYGKGEYEQVSKVNVLSKTLLVVTSIVGLYLSYGLLSLGLSAIVGALTTKLFLIRNLDEIALSTKIKFNYLNAEIKILKILSVNAIKSTVVQIGGFLIQRANIIIATIFMGASESSSYSLSITLLLTLSGISMAICQIQLPKITRLQLRLNSDTLAIKYGETIVICSIIYLTGSLMLLCFGNDMLNLIGSNVKILDKTYFTLLIVIYFLEMNHSLAGSYLTTLNDVPFLRAALISGLVIVIGTFILIPKLGVVAIIIMQGGVQLLYNNWKWPIEVSKKLKYNHYTLIKIGSISISKKLYLIKS
jgi:O-antigen/teichoic acid export membrane protein